jgi:DNA (cytosine-5)-methyltransferase 1
MTEYHHQAPWPHASAPREPSLTSRLSVAGLFAGIGGLELGLRRAGHTARVLCEIDRGAQAVLASHFPRVPLAQDIRDLETLPHVDLIAAGFPCQDLSQAGRTVGIDGIHSGLVGEVFRLLRMMEVKPRWLLLENVPFMLRLDRGRAMRVIVDSLEELGFRWAYRIVDARAFGLPQRRQRVLLLASITDDPRRVLFGDDAGEPSGHDRSARACGFYWTEGNSGLGWAFDAVPTLKGGSTIGIPSPPAIWMPWSRSIVVPDVRDAERLQGFPINWTKPAVDHGQKRPGTRWRLVGNAVSVPVARWVGERLRNQGTYDSAHDRPVISDAPWPQAAWGCNGEKYHADISPWPVRMRYRHLAQFLRFPVLPLSARASAGFLGRARTSKLRFVSGFLDDVTAHVELLSQCVDNGWVVT